MHSLVERLWRSFCGQVLLRALKAHFDVFGIFNILSWKPFYNDLKVGDAYSFMLADSISWTVVLPRPIWSVLRGQVAQLLPLTPSPSFLFLLHHFPYSFLSVPNFPFVSLFFAQLLSHHLFFYPNFSKFRNVTDFFHVESLLLDRPYFTPPTHPYTQKKTCRKVEGGGRLFSSSL